MPIGWIVLPAQLDGYTHLVVAFAVSYTWSPTGNNCNSDCDIATPPLCLGQTQSQIADWQALGKKVILSFGGAGMGGSWSGDTNNCWDHCFEREDAVSNQLVSIVEDQGYDGVDLDYEYCYDTATTGRHGRDCNGSGTGLYSDAKAKHFLEEMTVQLRSKLDALTVSSEKKYDLVHVPMDSDMYRSGLLDSPYFEIIKRQSANINYVMPQVS